MVAMNRVTLIGNLTRNPELRETTGGATVGNFGLAMNERYKTRNGEDKEDVCFVDIEVWGRQAEACGQHLHRGAPALIEGRLRSNTWEDKQTGKPRTKMLVRADRVQFLGFGNRVEGNNNQPQQAHQQQPAPPQRNTARVNNHNNQYHPAQPQGQTAR